MYTACPGDFVEEILEGDSCVHRASQLRIAVSKRGQQFLPKVIGQRKPSAYQHIVKLGNDVVRVQTVVIHQAVDLCKSAGQRSFLAAASVLPPPFNHSASECEFE